eukprot:gene47944-64325_t
MKQSVIPLASAGSGIVSISKTGEFMVWQPLFTPTADLKAPSSLLRKDLLLNVYSLSWKLSGMFSSKRLEAAQRPLERRLAIVASLDPSCMTVLLCRGDGFIEQVPIPGLISASDNMTKPEAVMTTTSVVWSKKKHLRPITAIKLWIDSEKCVIQEASFDPSPKSEFVAVAGTNSKRCVGYTADALCKLANESLCVTSSMDLSVVLWRRFSFSNPPRESLCFVTSPSPSSSNSHNKTTTTP